MKKKKKKSVLKVKEKILIAVGGFLVLFFMIGIALLPTRKQEYKREQTMDLNQELTTIESVVTYLESTFISKGPSEVEGYDLDIYVSFKYDLFEGEESKEIYFKNFYEKIAQVSKFKSFRILDNGKKIKIEVKCSGNKISEVKINDEENYFKNEISRRTKRNALNIETLNLEVNSQELYDLIQSNWKTENVNLGTPESKFYKYDVYFDEGYEIRTIQGRVFNIVFNKKYGKEVVAGYKPGANMDEIKALYGESYTANGFIGYKTNDFYVVFSNDEISIYPNRTYDYTEFEKLIAEYNEQGDANEFIYKLTDIWPDYDSYEYTNNSVELYYTLKGVKISFNSTNSDGIQIFENYKGDLRESTEKYKDTYWILNKNLMLETDANRRFVRELTGEWGSAEESLQNSDDFAILYNYENEAYNHIKIYSRREDCPNNEFEDHVTIKSYVWADNEHLIYSIAGDGIYIYTATTRETEKRIGGNQDFIITNYNRNTNALEYDGQTVTVSF